MAYIYKITNDINDKVYVGKTECSVEKRWKEHCREYRKDRCKNRPLYRAMNKHGVENFHIEPIEETNEPETREIYWIDFYDSYHNGYNATRGGDGKKYLDYDSIIETYKRVQNISETAIIHSVSRDAVKEIMIANGIEIKNSGAVLKELFNKRIGMFSKSNPDVLLMKFDSVADASRYLFSNKLGSASNDIGFVSHLTAVCLGKRKSAYGYVWKYL